MLVVAGVAAGVLAWQRYGGGAGVPGYGLEAFPVQAYAEAPGNLAGNRYVLRAQIYEQLARREGVGRLLTLAPDGSQTRLFVYVPAGLERNIHVGQRYRMQVRVGDEGLIEVMALEKY